MTHPPFDLLCVDQNIKLKSWAKLQNLSDSLKGKFWENLLYIMDSTTITLFPTILKGAGRNPKIGKKKGGIKAHTLIKASENVPCMICYTSAATHDHCLLKQINLPKGSYIPLIEPT